VLSAQGLPGTWQEREYLHVAEPDDREVPVVKRGDPGQPGASGDGCHGGIDDAKRKIELSLHEFGHAADVSALRAPARPPPDCHVLPRTMIIRRWPFPRPEPLNPWATKAGWNTGG
jgi:hypothetical protein